MGVANVKFTPISDFGWFQTAIELYREEEQGVGEKLRTHLEVRICQVCGAIRDREKWWIKVNNEEIVKKWREDTGRENKEMFDYQLK